jgi:hypothetical protein
MPGSGRPLRAVDARRYARPQSRPRRPSSCSETGHLPWNPSECQLRSRATAPFLVRRGLECSTDGRRLRSPTYAKSPPRHRRPGRTRPKGVHLRQRAGGSSPRRGVAASSTKLTAERRQRTGHAAIGQGDATDHQAGEGDTGPVLTYRDAPELPECSANGGSRVSVTLSVEGGSSRRRMKRSSPTGRIRQGAQR